MDLLQNKININANQMDDHGVSFIAHLLGQW